MILKTVTELGYIPKKIISLVPSQTELLYDLGLDAEVAGITAFCVHPEKLISRKIKIGGTKTVKREIIYRLQPDLIIANKEENVKQQVEVLAEKYPVWVTNISCLTDAIAMIGDIGQLTGKKEPADKLVRLINEVFEELKEMQSNKKIITAAYLIWRKPYMTVGGDTFIHDMLSRSGFQNVFSNRSRYPEISIKDLHESNCQYVLLSSEPYPFNQKHIDELKLQLPGKRIIMVNGEMFSWYGSRLLHAAAYLKSLVKMFV